MKTFGNWVQAASDFIWDWPLLILLMGGGAFFMIYSRFIPFQYFRHAIQILRGKYDDVSDPGQINHFQALSGALAATVGMGNISGVALAIVGGGPGVLFWMWVSAIFGMVTKYFTCSLAVMYRGKDSNGELQGGPMYVITEGLGRNWKPLAVFFSIAGFFGATPIFQTNQIVEVAGAVIMEPLGMEAGPWISKFAVGISIALLSGLVIIGGVKRIGSVASRMVPAMVVLYSTCVLLIIFLNYENILPSFRLIFQEAFSLSAIAGGGFLAVLTQGAKRAAFSNEAGIGTAPMMHGAAKTNEPVREGLVAMLGPFIDTLIVCTMTGLCILVSGLHESTSTGSLDAILLTAEAFRINLGVFGSTALTLCVLVFALTTIFSMAYYGRKCLSFLTTARFSHYFNYWYILLILVGSIASLQVVVNVVFVAYGLMAVPTMLSAILLAKNVMTASRSYFTRLKESTL